jgi:hypothetical protein
MAFGKRIIEFRNRNYSNVRKKIMKRNIVIFNLPDFAEKRFSTLKDREQFVEKSKIHF